MLSRPTQGAMADPLDLMLDRIPVPQLHARRPSVTLSYAQTLDGTIGTADRRPLQLSGAESTAATHRLRAAHEAILVGIGTVLADNPRLTARLDGAEQPQPVVLDSRLRLPLDCAVLRHPRPPILAATQGASPERRQQLEAAGARILDLPAAPDGRVDLAALLDRLGQLGIGSVMVEGGARVITSFLQARLADGIAVTLSPVYGGGLHAAEALGYQRSEHMPFLPDPQIIQLGRDLLVWGELSWPAD